MIYKKHILTKSNFSSHIHLMYIQLAKESIEYRVVMGKAMRNQNVNRQTREPPLAKPLDTFDIIKL